MELTDGFIGHNFIKTAFNRQQWVVELGDVLLVHNLEKPLIKADVVCCDLQ
jgi:hypothetical protein